MKYFILSMTALGIILSAEGAFAQLSVPMPPIGGGGVPIAGTLQTPGHTVGLTPQSNVPFTTVPAPVGAFLHGRGM